MKKTIKQNVVREEFRRGEFSDLILVILIMAIALSIIPIYVVWKIYPTTFLWHVVISIVLVIIHITVILPPLIKYKYGIILYAILWLLGLVYVKFYKK